MRIREIMSAPVHTVSHTMPLDQADDMMRRQRVHHLVVKESGRIVGVVSEHDIRQIPDDAARAGLRVGDLMSPSVATVADDDTVRSAANLMRGRSIGCVAVTHDGELAGIVTVSDLLTLLGRGGERRVANARASLHHRVPHRKQDRDHSW